MIIFSRGKRWRQDIRYAVLFGYPKETIRALKREPNLYERKKIFKTAMLEKRYEAIRLSKEGNI